MKGTLVGTVGATKSCHATDLTRGVYWGRRGCRKGKGMGEKALAFYKGAIAHVHRENVQWECVSFWQLMMTHPAATRSLSAERWSA